MQKQDRPPIAGPPAPLTDQYDQGISLALKAPFDKQSDQPETTSKSREPNRSIVNSSGPDSFVCFKSQAPYGTSTGTLTLRYLTDSCVPESKVSSRYSRRYQNKENIP